MQPQAALWVVHWAVILRSFLVQEWPAILAILVAGFGLSCGLKFVES